MGEVVPFKKLEEPCERCERREAELVVSDMASQDVKLCPWCWDAWNELRSVTAREFMEACNVRPLKSPDASDPPSPLDPTREPRPTGGRP